MKSTPNCLQTNAINVESTPPENKIPNFWSGIHFEMDFINNPLSSFFNISYLFLCSGFIFRVVLSPSEITEKIVIVDDGYDDVLVEFIKLCVSIQNGIDLAAPLTYFWTSRKFFFGGTMHFLPPDSSQVIKYSFWLQKANAVQVIAKLQPTLLKLKDSWVSVNRQFLVEILEKAGLMKPIDI